jgi:dienelactone hydrolase
VTRLPIYCCLLLSLASQRPALAEFPLGEQRKFEARDSLDIGREAAEDARLCLEGLAWPRQTFAIDCEEPKNGRYDVLVRFPSPVPSGDAVNDRVALEWHLARDKEGRPLKRPAVVVVHESGSGMTVGRLFAQGLRHRGLHTFMLQLPHYGERRTGAKRPKLDDLTTVIRQAIADVRRARDAVAVLPHVDATHIALQGTSLGGIVSATTAGLDRGYDSVFLLLAGGQLHDIIQHGARDTAKVRRELEEAGLTDEKLSVLLATIEPTRIAHRVDPQRTWLYTGLKDTVIPLKNATALAEAARLDDLHHVRMNADHYSGIIYVPFVLKHISDQIEESQAKP